MQSKYIFCSYVALGLYEHSSSMQGVKVLDAHQYFRCLIYLTLAG